jgi:hypothetical protein
MKSSWLFLLLMSLCGCPSTGDTCDPPAACQPADLAMSGPDLGAPSDLALPGDAGPPAETGVCSSDGWCWRNPLPQGNRLTAVSGTAANNVWAVGLFETII